MKAIIDYIDNFLKNTGKSFTNPVEANALLAKEGLLKDSEQRPGKPLRDLLRKGCLPYAYQTGGKYSRWIIPLSSTVPSNYTNY